MKSNSAGIHAVAKVGGVQVGEPKRKPAKLHTVPSTVTPQMRALIVSELRGGRSVPQVAKEYSVSADVVLELYVRDLERRLMGRVA